METAFAWLIINWFEALAALLGFVSIYFQIKQKPLYWPISIIMVSMYIFVYFKSGFYADMSLQFYYLIVGFYGWYYWVFGRNKTQKTTENIPEVTTLSFKGIITAVLVSIGIFIIIYLILKNFTNSEIPLGDAFTTGISFTATWLLARKILENWLFWIVVNVTSTGLYIFKELYPTAILFFALSILAVVGYIKWKKTMEPCKQKE